MALLSAELAGRLRGYWTPLLSDAVQAVACVFLFGIIAPLGTQDGAPYWVWLAAGLAPWFFYANALLGSASAYFAYAPLVRHRKCHSALIPPIRVTGALLHALPWLLLAFIAAVAAGCLSPRWYLLPYCLACGLLLGTAEGYFAAMFAPFFGHFVERGMRLTLSLFFWFTPIAWPAVRAGGPGIVQWLSPICYVVDMTRASLLAAAPLPAWNRTLWFLCLMAGLAVAGAAGSTRLQEPYREVL